MSNSSSSSTAPPPPPPKPPPIHTSTSLWNPIGDPGKLRACANAWTSLGSALTGISGNLDQSTATLTASWKGDASGKFQAWEGKLGTVLTDSAGSCTKVAADLNNVADYLEAKNAEIHHLYEAMIAAAAVGIGLSIITFGFSDAAAASAGAVMVADATEIVSAVGEFLTTMAEEVASTLSDFALTWAKAFAINLAFSETVKLVEGHPFSWSLDDLTGAINGATGGAALDGIVPDEFSDAHPYLTAGAGGVAGSALTNGMDGDLFTLKGLETMAVSGTVSGLVGGGLSSLHGDTFVDGDDGDDGADTPKLITLDPIPGDPSDLIIPGEPDPGYVPPKIVDPTAPTSGGGTLYVPGQPDPGYVPPKLVDPTAPTPGGTLYIPGAPDVGEGPPTLFVVRDSPVDPGSIPSQVLSSLKASLKINEPGVKIVDVGMYTSPDPRVVTVPIPGTDRTVQLNPGQGVAVVTEKVIDPVTDKVNDKVVTIIFPEDDEHDLVPILSSLQVQNLGSSPLPAG